MNLFDLFGSGTSLAATWLFTRTSMLAWPFGLVASAINLILFFKLGIYGDMALEAFYGVMMIYGWLLWRRHNDDSLPITHVTRPQAIHNMALTLLAIPFMAYFLKTYTHSSVPYLDAITTCMSLLAQWWLCQKRIETWFIWFFVDAFYVVLYSTKHIPFHSMTYAIYCVIAIIGYRNWARMRLHLTTPNAPEAVSAG